MSSQNWSSRLGVILAVAGSAVGLGNYLRFPGQVVSNGGGVFMIPYFVALLLLGIPICWAEWAMGRYAGQEGIHSCPFIFERIGKSRFWRYVGVFGVLIPVIVYMYYLVIETWCFAYALQYLVGGIDFGPDPTAYPQRSREFFSSVVGIAEDGSLVSSLFSSGLWCWILVFSLNFWVVYRGLSGGIEWLCGWALPLMAVCSLVILVRVLTLGTPDPSLPEQNVLNGLGFMWNPKPVGAGSDWYSPLLEPQVWMNAAGQIFFSLSVGFGVIVNYASYLKKESDVVLSGLTACATNEFFEVIFGGLITVTAAFVFLGASGAVGGTFGLGFNTLPVVFAHMQGGSIFGFLWFLTLFLAAITSSLSMLQPAIAFIEESAAIKRPAAVAILGVIAALGSFFVLYFSKDLAALDTLDFWVGTAMIFTLAMLQVILYSWDFGVKRGTVILHRGANIDPPKIFSFVIKYVSPTYLLAVFSGWCVINLPNYVRTFLKGGVPLVAMGVVGSVFIFFCILASMNQKAGKEES